MGKLIDKMRCINFFCPVCKKYFLVTMTAGEFGTHLSTHSKEELISVIVTLELELTEESRLGVSEEK
jgi:hypothetical protein